MNVAGFAEGENSVHEECKFSEQFISYCSVTERLVGEVEDLEILPEITPPARDESHRSYGGSGRKEGHDMAQE